jgi:hypothetical protein
VFYAKYREDGCQEGGIAGQADVCRVDSMISGQTIYSMEEPVLGDVAIDKRVI